MSNGDDLVERRVLPVALERTEESPVLLLEGPRTVGKSTLLRALGDSVGGELLDLDDVAVREAVDREPALMIAGPGPVPIDEYQRVPEVLDAIKAQLNWSSRPGQFILTGSAHHESLPRAAQALTGRLQRLAVLPLTQTEIEGSGTNLVASLLNHPEETIAAPPSTTTRQNYIERVVGGGFPLALTACSVAARSSLDR